MNALISQTVLETKVFIRNRASLFWTMAFPIFFMVLFGLIYGDAKMTTSMDMRTIDYLLPGIIVMGVMVTGIMVTMITFVSQREKGIFRRLSLTPLKRQTIIGGQMLHNYTVIIIQTLLLLVVGVAFFKVKITGNLFLFWLVLTVGALSFISIGFSLTSLAKSYRSAQPISQLVYFIMMFLGGIFFPNNMLPKFLGHVANALPSAHMNDALRVILFQGAGFGDIWQHLLVLLGWSAVCLIISIKFFRWE
jgi:ABC-2 type transport system permease protein